MYIVQGDYGFGWEDLTQSDSKNEATVDLICYESNDYDAKDLRLIWRDDETFTD